jgi:hypothetical protein
MTGLALAMDRHHRQLRPMARGPGRNASVVWRLAGAVLLALSFWMSVQVWGAAIGAVAWFGVISTVTPALVLLLPYAPTLAWRTGWVAAVTGLLVMLATIALRMEIV